LVRIATPDLGLSPIGGSGEGGDSNPVTAAVAHYDGLVSDGLRQLGADIPVLDGFGFFRLLAAHPTAFGLTDVSSPSYPTAGIGAFLAGPDDQVAPDVSGYLFSDSIHASATGHRLFGTYAIGVLTALKRWWRGSRHDGRQRHTGDELPA
jgi:outer membrane lipase/esterase